MCKAFASFFATFSPMGRLPFSILDKFSWEIPQRFARAFWEAPPSNELSQSKARPGIPLNPIGSHFFPRSSFFPRSDFQSFFLAKTLKGIFLIDSHKDNLNRKKEVGLHFFREELHLLNDFKAAEFRQYRLPVGRGPSGKRCPKRPSQRLHSTAIRGSEGCNLPLKRIFSGLIGCQKLGQPVSWVILGLGAEKWKPASCTFINSFRLIVAIGIFKGRLRPIAS